MKNSVKITLIVAAALVGLGLCLAAVGFCLGGRFSDLRDLRFDPATGQWEQVPAGKPTTDDYTGGDYVSDKTDITVLDIDWVTGDVKILLTDDDTITVTEKVGYNGYNAHPMVVTDDNGVLRIRYAEETWLSAIDPPQKELTVYLPHAVAEGLTEVTLGSVSADFELDALTVRDAFSFSSTSGDLKTGVITADAAAAELSTVSGKLELDGSFLQLTGESTSGEIDLALRNSPEKLDLVTVSGDVELKLRGSTNFWLDYSTVSGDLESESDLQQRDGHYYRGLTMGCAMTITTTSGDLTIEELR